MMADAFAPYDLAGITLKNRIVMAPMTRSRAEEPERTATALMATYYAQRASAGLIVSEGIQPSVEGQGYTNTPGLHSAAQVASWKPVTQAVHDAGGVIFAQLMHTGRIGHPSSLPDGVELVGPSAIKASGQIFTDKGLQDFVTPRAMTQDDVEAAVAQYATSASNAIEAGFDGVEIHGANGYLIHQFLSVNANQRTDQWGGTPANRIRFARQVAQAVAAAVGAHRTGIRLSPGNPLNDIVEDADLAATYVPLLNELAGLDLAYVHVMETGPRDLTTRLRQAWANTFILNPNTRPAPTGPTELTLIEDGTTDLLAFGALFLANPDLPARLRAGGPFNQPNRQGFFGGDEHGYTDYPTLDQVPA
jgi:N-ethylmaleimide reductase